MFHHETSDAQRFEQVILEAVRQVLASSGPDEFLGWARTHIPPILVAQLFSREAQINTLQYFFAIFKVL